jgi:hypothetical protein
MCVAYAPRDYYQILWKNSRKNIMVVSPRNKEKVKREVLPPMAEN